jgi:hypothetical protein
MRAFSSFFRGSLWSLYLALRYEVSCDVRYFGGLRVTFKAVAGATLGAPGLSTFCLVEVD